MKETQKMKRYDEMRLELEHIDEILINTAESTTHNRHNKQITQKMMKPVKYLRETSENLTK